MYIKDYDELTDSQKLLKLKEYLDFLETILKDIQSTVNTIKIRQR